MSFNSNRFNSGDTALEQLAGMSKLRINGKTRYIGHAGTADYAPENTIPAYKTAYIMGQWGAECDLEITSDGKLVLMHDATVDRTTNGTGTVASKTLAQIQALAVDLNLYNFINVTVPTIDEYLLACKQYGLYPVIEVKVGAESNGVIDALLPILKRYNLLRDCIVISFSEAALRYVRTKNSYINLAFILDNPGLITSEHIAIAKSIGNCAIDAYGTTDITAAMVEACHDEGIPVMVWTINTRATATYLEGIGVDAITTDVLTDPRREKKMISGSASSSDKGLTWASVANNLRDSALISIDDIDAYTIEITFADYLKQAIMNLVPLAKVMEVTSNPTTRVICHAWTDTTAGTIKVKFFDGGTLIALTALKAYVHIYVELIF